MDALHPRDELRCPLKECRRLDRPKIWDQRAKNTRALGNLVAEWRRHRRRINSFQQIEAILWTRSRTTARSSRTGVSTSTKGLRVAGPALGKRGLTRGTRIGNPPLNPNILSPEMIPPNLVREHSLFAEAPAFCRCSQPTKPKPICRATVPLTAVEHLWPTTRIISPRCSR